MSELTPERIRDAAEVVQRFGWKDEAGIMREHARDMERAQAAEAKREKRAAELAVELRDLYSYHSWRHLADVLLTRYPALADGPEL